MGDTLFREGQVSDRFSVIVEGRIEWTRCINGVDVALGQREAPTYAGASNLLTGDGAVATGRAATELRLLSWTRGTSWPSCAARRRRCRRRCG